AEKTEGEDVRYDWPPGDACVLRHGDTKSGAVEGHRKVDDTEAWKGDRQSSHGGVQRAIGHTVGQPLQGGFLEPVAQLGLARYAPPEIDADAVPGAILSFHRERWRYFRADNQFA